MKTFYRSVVLLALMAPALTSAQDGAVSAVKAYFQQNQARYGVGAADVQELVVTDAYTSRGLTHVYLRQAFAGIPVWNARANATVARDGSIAAPHARFVSGLADRVNTTQPTLSAEAAAAAAVRHLARTEAEWRLLPTVLSDEPGELDLPADYFVPTTERAGLYFFATETGTVRLVWNVEVQARDGAHWWALRVDAENGQVLDLHDYVAHDHWGFAARGSAEPPSLAPFSAAAAMPAPPAASGTYNVFPIPLESPIHGPQTVVTNPHHPTASPQGWHSDGTNSFTITRGNNVYASEDRDANNSPGLSPDGGPGLVFNFPFDPTQPPVNYQELAITNLFYWNNIVHDVLYLYGFDEPSRNFQQTNFTSQGLGNDFVWADAQDGSGTNNANFSTPPDGSRPRMQMFEWDAPPGLDITAPPEIAGPRLAGGAQFGPPSYDITANVVVARTAEGDPAHACGGEDIGNQSELAGNIALIPRGAPFSNPNDPNCFFQNKARQAQNAGAIGVIIYNCVPNPPQCNATHPEQIITMALATGQTNDITIGSQFVARSTGLALANVSPNGEAHMTLSAIDRDSDLDAGIITHEYGHGISNRLTGNASGCITNHVETGSEGWSDWYGLMLTQRTGDTGPMARPVGRYVTSALREAPYSTDFTINDWTYGDTRTLTQVHSVGFVWATILWEATWEVINAFGYSSDIYNADGTAGNQVMLNIVTEAFKIQPCQPGFVDARDAILDADSLLYGGAHDLALWTGFARRGLGQFAVQGSSGTNGDNVEDFTIPTIVANEPGAGELPEGYALSEVYPNPFNPQARFTLEVAETQPVLVELYDALGRRVATLHDGALAAGTAHAFTVDGRGLASGLYMVRATGETFTATRRVTLLK